MDDEGRAYSAISVARLIHVILHHKLHIPLDVLTRIRTGAPTIWLCILLAGLLLTLVSAAALPLGVPGASQLQLVAVGLMATFALAWFGLLLVLLVRLAIGSICATYANVRLRSWGCVVAVSFLVWYLAGIAFEGRRWNATGPLVTSALACTWIAFSIPLGEAWLTRELRRMAAWLDTNCPTAPFGGDDPHDESLKNARRDMHARRELGGIEPWVIATREEDT